MKNKKNKLQYFTLIISFLIISALLFGYLNKESEIHSESNSKNISDNNLKKIVFSLVSSAENSTLDYNEQYSYIEDIGDGRGYTAGIIGFTSGTGDLLDVVNEYCKLKKNDNLLKKYIPVLKLLI